VDAAAALDALPLAEVGTEAGPTSSNLDPRERLRLLLGGPVPFSVYAAMTAGGLGGALIGMIYDQVVLEQRVVWIPLLLAVLGEAWIGARYGARRIGHPLTVDQRARVAIGFTCAVTLPLVAGLVWFYLPWSVVERTTQLSSPGIAVALAVGIGVVLATALLRYLLLALFTSRRTAPSP
jgi:hypothetical protein